MIMIIEKKNLNRVDASQNITSFQYQAPSFEVRIDSTVQISSSSRSSNPTVDAPVSRELAVTASEMINSLAMRFPEMAVKTQANSDRDKVKLLLQDYI